MLPFLKNKNQRGASIGSEVKASDFDKKKASSKDKPKKSKAKIDVDHKKLFSVSGAEAAVKTIKLKLPKNVK